MSIKNNTVQTLIKVKDNLEAIGGTLKDNSGTVIDVTGETILFRMVSLEDGSVKINNQSATVDSGTAGQVSYSPAAGDFDTAGEYAAFFIIDGATDQRFPFDGAKFRIHVIDEQDRWDGY